MEELLLEDVGVANDWRGKTLLSNVYLDGHKLIVKYARSLDLIKKKNELGQEPLWFEVDLRESRVTAQMGVIKFTHLNGKKLKLLLCYPVIELVPVSRANPLIAHLLERGAESGRAKEIANHLNSFSRIEA